MNAALRCGGLLLVALAAPRGLQAAEPRSDTATAEVPDTETLQGHYYLQGIMETGSELLLKPDGRFQWYFSYGAMDLEAEGRWQAEAGRIVLLPETFRHPPQFPEVQFQRMQLRIDGRDLIPAWPWEGGAERGRYSRD